MKTILPSVTIATALALAAFASNASAAVQCDTLKSAIAAKLDAKGVKGYSLDVVAADGDTSKGAVVGSCEAGSKKIVYQRAAKS